MATRMLNEYSQLKIKQWENGGDGSPKLEAYRDSGGVWTIGTGHTGKVNGKPVTRGMIISKATAEELFLDDIQWACDAISSLIKVDLNDNQYGALVSWCLNIGRTQAANSTLVKKLNLGQYDAVPHELMKWVKDRDPKTGKLVTVKGLVNRRAAECGLWAKEDFVTSAVSETSPANVQAAVPAPAARDVAAHVATGGLGAVAVGWKPISDLVDALTSQQAELSSGDFVRIAVAGLIVAGTLYVAWRKYKE